MPDFRKCPFLTKNARPWKVSIYRLNCFWAKLSDQNFAVPCVLVIFFRVRVIFTRKPAYVCGSLADRYEIPTAFLRPIFTPVRTSKDPKINSLNILPAYLEKIWKKAKMSKIGNNLETLLQFFPFFYHFRPLF